VRRADLRRRGRLLIRGEAISGVDPPGMLASPRSVAPTGCLGEGRSTATTDTAMIARAAPTAVRSFVNQVRLGAGPSGAAPARAETGTSEAPIGEARGCGSGLSGIPREAACESPAANFVSQRTTGWNDFVHASDRTWVEKLAYLRPWP